MRSFIAALRTLTLPYGATTGPRIILDGVDGRIEVYSNTGNLLLTIDDDGINIYDDQGDIRMTLGDITAFSSIIFRNSVGANPAYVTYQPTGADYEALSIQSPDLSTASPAVINFHRLFLLTAFNNSATKNPLLQWDTGFCNPAGAQPIADLTGFTGGLAARTVVNDLWRGSSNGGGNAPTSLTSYPRGVIAKARKTSNTLFSTETTVHTINGVTLESGRRYKLTFYWRSMAWNTAAAAVICQTRIKSNGTQRIENSLLVDGATGRQGGVCETTIDCPGEIAAGNHDFLATVVRATGAGDLNLEAAGTYPTTLVIEDVGSSLT